MDSTVHHLGGQAGRSRSAWLLPGGIALLLLMGALILGPAPEVVQVRQLIRATARTSLGCFLLAYTAQAAWVLWPGAVSQWVRQHRRQWGLLLVVSHTIHAMGIAALAVQAPEVFQMLTPMATRMSGSVAYVLLWSMGATSFDRSARWLGSARWAWLHTWGSHYLWLSFLVAYGKRVPHDAVYAMPVIVLLLAQGLRQWGRFVQIKRAAPGP